MYARRVGSFVMKGVGSMGEQLALNLSPKARGQARALQALDPAYRKRFREAVESIISRGEPFTVDEVIEITGLPNPDGKNNSVGGLMSQLAHTGLIKKVGSTTATRSASHGRLIHLWAGVNYGKK